MNQALKLADNRTARFGRGVSRNILRATRGRTFIKYSRPSGYSQVLLLFCKTKLNNNQFRLATYYSILRENPTTWSTRVETSSNRTAKSQTAITFFSARYLPYFRTWFQHIKKIRWPISVTRVIFTSGSRFTKSRFRDKEITRVALMGHRKKTSSRNLQLYTSITVRGTSEYWSNFDSTVRPS